MLIQQKEPTHHAKKQRRRRSKNYSERKVLYSLTIGAIHGAYRNTLGEYISESSLLLLLAWFHNILCLLIILPFPVNMTEDDKGQEYCSY